MAREVAVMMRRRRAMMTRSEPCIVTAAGIWISIRSCCSLPLSRVFCEDIQLGSHAASETGAQAL